MAVVSKHVCSNKLVEAENKYSSTYHRPIIIKIADFQPGMYIEYSVEHNNKDPRFKVRKENTKILKYLGKGLHCKLV